VQHDGKAQVSVCVSQRIRSYDLATEEQIWAMRAKKPKVSPHENQRGEINAG
jgi:hypothetical protein